MDQFVTYGSTIQANFKEFIVASTYSMIESETKMKGQRLSHLSVMKIKVHTILYLIIVETKYSTLND